MKKITISFVGFLAIAAGVVVLAFGVLYLIRWSVKSQDLAATEVKGLTPGSQEIPQDAGIVQIAQEGRYRVNLNTASLNVAVEDTVTGRVWNTLVDDNDQFPGQPKSPMIIRFIGQNNAFYEWDAYSGVISPKQYTITRIPQGVRIMFDFKELESYRLGEYIPDRISLERYESIFVDHLEELVEDGTIPEDKAALYRTALRAMYGKETEKGYYYNKFAGLPPATVVKSLVELTQILGYTREDLVTDSAEFGLEVQIEIPPAFTVYMEITFQNGELVVNIPVYEQKSNNDFYTLQNVTVFPGFDCARDEKNDGYIFVPDGAGMLVALDSYNPKFPEYSRELYDNTLFDTKYEKSSYDEELQTPVFGMYRRDAETGITSGFMAIIESGAETAHIGMKLRSKNSNDGAFYNAVYSSADTMQYSRVKIFGPYSTDDSRYLAMTGLISFDYTVRYKFYPEDAGYYAFARDYQKYLMEKYGLTREYDNRAKVFLELVGAVTVLDTFLGVPYYPTVSMTTYTQAAEILDDLQDEDVSLVTNYKYVFNGGRMNFFGNKADLISVNGKAADLKSLLARSKAGNEIFLEASLMRVYRKQTLYDYKWYYVMGYDGAGDWKASFNDRWFPDGTWAEGYAYALYYLVHPRYLSTVTDGFLKDAGAYDAIALTDFGSHYYGNYNPRDIVDPIKTNNQAVIANLQKIAATKTVALDNPNADKIPWAAYSLNVSRESSDFGVSYTSVPFRQLVMNGLTQFTTLDVNGARSGEDYFLLQALETGALPKFTVFAEKADVLMEAHISQYFAAEYAHVAPTIKDLYKAYEAAFKRIGTKEIVNHETLAPNVYGTTYANGVRVLVNYNLYPVTVGAYKLDAEGYRIFAKGETAW